MKTAKELLSETISPLLPTDTGLTALHWFDEYKISHLPVADDKHFLGVVSEEDVFSQKSFEEPVSLHAHDLRMISARQNDHLFDVLRLFAEFKLTTLPVLDDNSNYLGLISYSDLLESVVTMTGAADPGGIIVLEMNLNDLSMSEIAQIVESNNTKVMNYFVTTRSDSLRCEVTLKLNRMDIQPVLEAFYRYSYMVKASFLESDYHESIRDRFNNLMNYLNM